MEIIFEMNILLIIGLPLWIIIRGVILLFRTKDKPYLTCKAHT